MSKESFAHRETEPLFKQLEEVSQASGVSRGVAFEDFLHISVAALAHPTMEDEYLQTLEKHKSGEVGKRGVDRLARMFATMIDATERSCADVLGDLFQGAVRCVTACWIPEKLGKGRAPPWVIGLT